MLGMFVLVVSEDDLDDDDDDDASGDDALVSAGVDTSSVTAIVLWRFARSQHTRTHTEKENDRLIDATNSNDNRS